jgi:hypothetical protein
MIERRNVLVQLQRWIPQTVTVVVAVPEIMTDDDLKGELTHIYEESEPDTHSWCDMDDYDPREGDHEISGEADPRMKVDLVWPPEEEDAEESEEQPGP